MSMIIGRRQIILAALVLALGTAIFLNYTFTSGGGLNLASVFNPASSLGDASYVNKNVSGTSTNTFFATARVDRQQARATSKDLLNTVTANANATELQKQSAVTAIEMIAKNISSEKNIETLVVAKGFADCVAFISDNGSVTVVVKPKSGDTLSVGESAQIKDIVLNQAKVSVDKIYFVIAK
jgi:stage III sporulation protein AH